MKKTLTLMCALTLSTSLYSGLLTESLAFFCLMNGISGDINNAEQVHSLGSHYRVPEKAVKHRGDKSWICADIEGEDATVCMRQQTAVFRGNKRPKHKR